MKTRFRLFFLGLPFFVLFVAAVGLVPKPVPSKMDKVMASMAAVRQATALNPQTIDFNQASGRANFVRFLYFLVNGPTSSYTIDGPENGLLGMINQITGPDALGGGLQSAGYTECSSIPISGSATAGDSVYAMNFAAGSKTIPSHFSEDAGQTFDVRISVTKNSVAFMSIEIKCSASSDTETIYLRMDDDRDMEVYAQQNSQTKAVDLLFFMVYTAQSEKMAVAFSTADGVKFNLWLIRSDSSSNSFVGLHGDTSLNLANFMMSPNSSSTDTSTITSSSNDDCLDLSSNTSVTTCSSNSLDVTDPTATTSLNGVDFVWTINHVANVMALSPL